MRMNITIPKTVVSTEGDASKIQIACSSTPDCQPTIVIKVGELHIEFDPLEAFELGSDILKAVDIAENVEPGIMQHIREASYEASED